MAATLDIADLPRLAINLAEIAHYGQKDKAEVPYIEHVRRVGDTAALLATGRDLDPNLARTIGYLHDTEEDTPVKLGLLADLGFPELVVHGVDSVSRRPGESYDDLIYRSVQDPYGHVVKLADIYDHLQQRGEYQLPGSLLNRYLRARQILEH